jgi:hypothetical protein
MKLTYVGANSGIGNVAIMANSGGVPNLPFACDWTSRGRSLTL